MESVSPSATGSPSVATSFFSDLPDPSSKPLPYIVTALTGILLLYTFTSTFRNSNPNNLHHVNPKKPLDITGLGSKKAFYFQCRKLLGDWFGKNPDKAVRIITSDVGELMVLPPHLTNEIRSDPRLTFSDYIYKAFHAHLPGFEGFREGSRDSHIVQAVIMKDLTKYLNKVTEPLAEETALAITDYLPVGANNGMFLTPRVKDYPIRSLTARPLTQNGKAPTSARPSSTSLPASRPASSWARSSAATRTGSR